MAQVREVLARIGSVRNTQKITKAMKMVAAAKLTRAQAQMESVRRYAGNLARAFSGIHSNLFGDEHPLLVPRPNPARALYIVIAGDRGLCGGFNNNIFRYLEQQDLTRGGAVQARFFAIGKRGIANVRKHYGRNSLLKTWTDVFDKLSFQLTDDISRNLLRCYLSPKADERIDAVYLVYNRFISRIRQEVVIEGLMPIDLKDLIFDAGTGDMPAYERRLVYAIEPDPVTAMSALIEHYLSVDIFHAVIESYAAELAARVNAMDNATSSAEEMIDNLTLLYNRARQAGITNELLDIIGGANALG